MSDQTPDEEAKRDQVVGHWFTTGMDWFVDKYKYHILGTLLATFGIWGGRAIMGLRQAPMPDPPSVLGQISADMKELLADNRKTQVEISAMIDSEPPSQREKTKALIFDRMAQAPGQAMAQVENP